MLSSNALYYREGVQKVFLGVTKQREYHLKDFYQHMRLVYDVRGSF